MDFNHLQFDSSTSSAQWREYLSTLNENSDCLVFSNPVSYRDAAQKNNMVNEVTARTYNTTEERDQAISNYSIPSTITTAAGQFNSTAGTIYLMTGRCYNYAGRLRELRDYQTESWHCFAIHIRKGCMAIYDPDFDDTASYTRLREVSGLNLALQLVQRLKRLSRALKEVWVGGGGNSELQCQEMCRAWLHQEIVVAGGQNLQNWEQRGWTKLKPN
jgi:hypothetical protein